MAELSQLTRYLESYIDSSSIPFLQAATLEAIACLVKNNTLTLEALVREMGMYLTATDNIIRARGRLESITRFPCWLFGTDEEKSNAGTITSSDAKAVAQSYLEHLQVQFLGQHDRKLCLELLDCLLEHYSDAVAPLGDDLVYGICEAIDAEKDPECLMLAFHMVEFLGRLYPDPSGPLASLAGECWVPTFLFILHILGMGCRCGKR